MKIQSSRTVVRYLVAVFVAGLAVGAMTGYTVARRSPSRLPSERQFEDGWLARYKSELSLTDAQLGAIQPLLPPAVERIGGAWYRAIMTMGAIQESVDRKVEPLLDEPQREKLVALIRQGREKRLRVAGERFDERTGRQDHIWYAAAIGDAEAIRQHLRKGVDVNKQDLAFGMTPLSVAAVHGQAETLVLLLQEGADVNARHPDGNTALHSAAFFGRLECVQRLLEHGADIRARNEDGRTPLESMAADWDTLQFIGAILQIELDKDKVLAGRKAVAELLQARGGEDQTTPGGAESASGRQAQPQSLNRN